MQTMQRNQMVKTLSKKPDKNLETLREYLFIAGVGLKFQDTCDCDSDFVSHFLFLGTS